LTFWGASGWGCAEAPGYSLAFLDSSTTEFRNFLRGVEAGVESPVGKRVGSTGTGVVVSRETADCGAAEFLFVLVASPGAFRCDSTTDARDGSSVDATGHLDKTVEIRGREVYQTHEIPDVFLEREGR
jgi:hypothetical protein